MLLALAAIWGSSFMFIKVGVRELAPGRWSASRLLVGTLVLLPRRRLVTRRARPRRSAAAPPVPLLVVGLFNSALPFWVLAWTEKRLDSGLAAVMQASMPLFTALLALRFSRAERVTGCRLVGVLVGFGGVVLLVGVAAERRHALGARRAPHGALLRRLARLHAGARLRRASPTRDLLGALGDRDADDVPLGIAQLPDEAPGWKVIGSILVLGAVGLGGRVPPLLRADRRRGCVVRGDRHVSRACVGAGLRCDLPR